MNVEIDAISQAGRSGNILRVLHDIPFTKYVGHLDSYRRTPATRAAGSSCQVKLQVKN
jgi:hypothetical protein